MFIKKEYEYNRMADNNNEKNEEEGVLVKCPHCQYTWRTKSRMIYTTCSNCKNAVHIQRYKINKEHEK